MRFVEASPAKWRELHRAVRKPRCPSPQLAIRLRSPERLRETRLGRFRAPREAERPRWRPTKGRGSPLPTPNRCVREWLGMPFALGQMFTPGGGAASYGLSSPGLALVAGGASISRRPCRRPSWVRGLHRLAGRDCLRLCGVGNALYAATAPSFPVVDRLDQLSMPLERRCFEGSEVAVQAPDRSLGRDVAWERATLFDGRPPGASATGRVDRARTSRAVLA
jgi:hypothetical protein